VCTCRHVEQYPCETPAGRLRKLKVRHPILAHKRASEKPIFKSSGLNPNWTSSFEGYTRNCSPTRASGVIPWEKPWKTPHFHEGPFPRNFRTGKPYRGVNVLLLWSSPYSSPFWLTFKQALDLKGSVRKGEKGTAIVFYKHLQNRKEDPKATDEKKERSPFVLCYYTVWFHCEVCCPRS
jgi:N-terminal domain of anti-restriction factor ArdC